MRQAMNLEALQADALAEVRREVEEEQKKELKP